MPSVKEIYHKIDDVRIEADTINLNVDGLEALASTQQADVAAIKADIANGVTINQPVAVTDNNGSLTVDGTVGISGTVPVSGTFWQSIQPVEVRIGGSAAQTTNPLSVQLSQGQLPVTTSNRVPVQSSIQDASGNTITSTVDGSKRRLDVTLASAGTRDATPPITANLYAGTDGTFLRAISTDSSGRINTNINGTVPVSGTFWQATQPISGAVTANVDSQSLFSALENYSQNWNDAFPVAIKDVIGDIPISGTVTADSNRGNLTAASTQSITTGGTHQQVFASNASRKFLLVQNLSDTDMYLGIGFNPSNTTPDGILLSKSGGGIVFESSYIPTQEIRIVCATTGKRFEALEA